MGPNKKGAATSTASDEVNNVQHSDSGVKRERQFGGNNAKTPVLKAYENANKSSICVEKAQQFVPYFVLQKVS